MKTLTTPVVVQNLTKIQVDKFANHLDDSPPYALVTAHVQSNDGTVYWSGTLQVFDAQNSDVIAVNASPVGFGDKIIGGRSQLTNAYTALVAADAGATGNRRQHLNAIEAACMTVGVFGAGLAGT
jgi:hypothetical protein